jgi:hypothetical protein
MILLGRLPLLPMAGPIKLIIILYREFLSKVNNFRASPSVIKPENFLSGLRGPTFLFKRTGGKYAVGKGFDKH